MKHVRNVLCGLIVGLLYILVCWWIFAGVTAAECRRVIERLDGVSIVVPARVDQQPGETEAAWCARVFQRAIEADPALQGRPFHDVDSADIPTDRSQRNKWRYQGGRVQVNPSVPDRPPSTEQRRKDACSKIEHDATASPGLKELCATF